MQAISQPDVISPRKANRQAAGLPSRLPFPSRHYTHTSLAQPEPSHPFYSTPHPLCASGQLLWLKVIKDDSLLALSFFFFSLPASLSTSLFFPCWMKGLPDTHSMHIPFRPGHTGSLCAAQRRGWGRGRGGDRGKGRGGRALSTEGERREWGGVVNASHVKLMRTNLQKLESYFPFSSSAGS